ncbi:unnamed protein product, partial [Bubo scandiacus]
MAAHTVGLPGRCRKWRRPPWDCLGGAENGGAHCGTAWVVQKMAAPTSCLAAPHGHQREGGAALSCTISKLALSPAAKSPGGGCSRGPYSHLRSQGAATLFSLLQRSMGADGSHFNCAS